MTPIVLYCKSYSTDVLRVKRLAESVDRYNTQALPFYVSAPEKDLPLFREHLKTHKVIQTIYEDRRGDLLPVNHTSYFSKESINPENDGHEKQQIQQTTNHS